MASKSALEAFAEAREALIKEREALLARVAEINVAIGGRSRPAGAGSRGPCRDPSSLMSRLERIVIENPGASASEVRRALGERSLGINRTLGVLVRSGRLRQERGEHGFLRFYPPLPEAAQ